MQNQSYSDTSDRGLWQSNKESQPKKFYKDVAEGEDKGVSFAYECWRALIDGVFGGLTFMILIVYIFSNTLMAGHLHNSEVYVEAFGIAGVYGNIFSFFVWGFNSGFIITASRCFGLGDFFSMHRFFKKQVVFIFGIAACFYLYLCVIYLLLPKFYPEDPNLLYWTKAYMVCAMPVNFCAFYMDTFRELYIANEQYSDALLVETFSMICSFFLCYFLAFTLNWDFYGLIVGMIVTQSACVGLYILMWIFLGKWKTYWIESKIKALAAQAGVEAEDGNYKVPLLKAMSGKGSNGPETDGKHSEVVSQIHDQSDNEEAVKRVRDSVKKSKEGDNDKVATKQEEKVDLNSNWGYFKFNIVFSFTMFLDGFWWQMDAVLCSFLFPGPSVAAQTSLTQFLNVITLFSYGYTMTLSSKISQYLVILDVKRAKRIFWIITVQMAIFGVLLGSPFIIFPKLIAPLVIDSPDTQVVLVSIMRIFGASVPFMFLSAVSFSTNRSINNQNKYFICQLVCNYGVHFGSFIWFKYSLGMGVEALWYAYLASQVSITVVGFLMVFFTNWDKEAEKICEQMEKGEGPAAGGH